MHEQKARLLLECTDDLQSSNRQRSKAQDHRPALFLPVFCWSDGREDLRDAQMPQEFIKAFPLIVSTRGIPGG